MNQASNSGPNWQVINHPLVQQKLGRVRDSRTDNETFRRLLNDISRLMCYEITRDVPVRTVAIDTPLESAEACELDVTVVLVPILRAGLGMLDGMLELIPNARVGFIGLYRDETTLEPIEYYGKFPPDLGSAFTILVDPMLATGGSAADAVTKLKERGATNIKFMALVASPAGLQVMRDRHPDVMIYTAAVDRGLNAKSYIVPGLGDAGDRLYGTR
ncbi:MAG: uracil phosphoribosyltransferase [Leptospirales bacterium]|jgi:uracil phosphoribosyltransferase